LPDKRLIALIY